MSYNIKVQLLEIYNEQLRDLLDTSRSQRKLEIRSTEPSGLNVPEAIQVLQWICLNDNALLLSIEASVKTVSDWLSINTVPPFCLSKVGVWRNILLTAWFVAAMTVHAEGQSPYLSQFSAFWPGKSCKNGHNALWQACLNRSCCCYLFYNWAITRTCSAEELRWCSQLNVLIPVSLLL